MKVVLLLRVNGEGAFEAYIGTYFSAFGMVPGNNWFSDVPMARNDTRFRT
jgi:hypothetical protein